MTELTCTSAAAALRQSELTPLDLVERCLERIERFEPTIQAWVMIDADGARRQAALLGEELRRGFDRGPLHGIPIGIKDVIDVEGWPTLAGSPLRAGHVAPRDADVVARLRRAGAIILGKTVTCEYACFDPAPTRNPWNLDRTPGGSSAGSAAAVAMGMCLAAVGTQTGGSITRPASYCGVAGCKPAYGVVPTDGVVPVSHTLDHVGAIARSVDDLQAMTAVMCGESCKSNNLDPTIPQLTFSGPMLTQLSAAIFTASTVEAYNAMARDVFQPAYDILQPAMGDDAGWLVTLSMQNDIWVNVLLRHRRIMAYEALEYHRERYVTLRDRLGPKLVALLVEGENIDRNDYLEALAHREQFRRLLLEQIETLDLLTMATVTAAPGRETTGDGSFNAAWSYLGLPTVSVPCGLTRDGLPAAVQLVGHPDHMPRLFDAARWVEQRVNFTALPTMLTA
jgi:aspartyl-tRNA(Asn)/glutamyl-tRNA(Gln) amidotransferase subunit A